MATVVWLVVGKMEGPPSETLYPWGCRQAAKFQTRTLWALHPFSWSPRYERPPLLWTNSDQDISAQSRLALRLSCLASWCQGPWPDVEQG